MKKYNLLLLSFILAQLSLLAQGSAGESAKFEYRNLIDMPAAGILEKGYVGVINNIMPGGVVISKLEVGVFENVSFGISYGGANIIGSGKPDWYNLPGVNIRFRFLNESITFPALTIGFDSQGKGFESENPNRYQIKSPGFFTSASKNFQFLGYLSLHATANYSLEKNDGDNFLNFKFGAEKTIGKSFSFVTEYDFGFNDNSVTSLGKGNGYLNMGFKLSVASGFTISLEIRDVFNNKRWNPNSADRALTIEYIQSIFWLLLKFFIVYQKLHIVAKKLHRSSFHTNNRFFFAFFPT